MHCIVEVRSGRLLDLWHMNPEDVDLLDISHALSHLCRFNGHTREFYSVATHSRLALANAIDSGMVYEGDHNACRAILFHDAHEAYLGDITKPIKRLLGPDFGLLADRLDDVIFWSLDIQMTLELRALVREVDGRMLMTEKRDLLAPGVEWGASYGEPFRRRIRRIGPTEFEQALFLHDALLHGLAERANAAAWALCRHQRESHEAERAAALAPEEKP